MKVDIAKVSAGLTTLEGPFNLAGQMGAKGVFLYFMREFGCSQCQGHVAQLVKAAPELAGLGLNVVVIGGGNANDAAKIAKRFSTTFPVVADQARASYEVFGLDKVLGVMQKSGSFIVEPDGTVDFELRSTLPNGLNLEAAKSSIRSAVTSL